DAITPVLTAVVVGIIKIHPHALLRIEGDTQYGNGVPTDKAGGAVSHRNAGRLWMNQRLVAIVIGVISSIKMADEVIQIDQRTRSNIDIDAKPAARPPAVKLRVHPAMGISLPV